MNNILRASEKILDQFILIRKSNPTFVFVPRKINKGKRLDQGYWFLGNEWYLNLSLWEGMDWKEKVHMIGFSLNHEGKAYLELSAQGNPAVVPFLNALAQKIPGLRRNGNKYKWFKELPGTDITTHINYLTNEFKPVVDELIERIKPPDINFVTETSFRKYYKNIIDRRNARVDFGEHNKMARLVWNKNGWKFPSGYEGKSLSEGNFEASSGYGHEEWLFDRTKLLNGYHYGFLQALNLNTGVHLGKFLNITLYTTFKNERFFVGKISNAEPIDINEGIWAYEEYQKRGWLKQMQDDLQFVKADVNEFIRTSPDIFFNLKFRFSDVSQPDELQRISINDPNITSHRFNLLKQKIPIVIDDTTAEDLREDEGKEKSTAKIKRTVNYDSEFSPYHNAIQNELKKLLTNSKLYKRVYIEKGRVDIKGYTKDGEWHYFEIKTDSPKICVRKALGQILEYGHFPSAHRARKLIIVGDTEPDEPVIAYLNLLRGTYGLPITYRYFDFDKKTLSADF